MSDSLYQADSEQMLENLKSLLGASEKFKRKRTFTSPEGRVGKVEGEVDSWGCEICRPDLQIYDPFYEWFGTS